MFQTNMKEPNRLRKMLETFVQGEREIGLQNVRLLRDKRDADEISSIVNSFRSKAQGAKSRSEIAKAMNESFMQTSPENKYRDMIGQQLQKEAGAMATAFGEKRQQDYSTEISDLLRNGVKSTKQIETSVGTGTQEVSNPAGIEDILGVQAKYNPEKAVESSVDLALRNLSANKSSQSGYEPFQNPDGTWTWVKKGEAIPEGATPKSIVSSKIVQGGSAVRQEKTIGAQDERQDKENKIQSEEADKKRILALKDDNAKYLEAIGKYKFNSQNPDATPEQKQIAEGEIGRLQKQIEDNNGSIVNIVKKYPNWKQPEQWNNKQEAKKEESNKFNRKQMVDDFVKEEGREPTLQELEALKQQGLWE